MSEKQSVLVVQPSKTILSYHYPDGTTFNKETIIWYDNEVAHIDINIEYSDLAKQQLAKKDEEIARLKETITLLNQNAYNAEVADANAIHELEFLKSQYENLIKELKQQLEIARQQIEKGDGR